MPEFLTGVADGITYVEEDGDREEELLDDVGRTDDEDEGRDDEELVETVEDLVKVLELVVSPPLERGDGDERVVDTYGRGAKLIVLEESAVEVGDKLVDSNDLSVGEAELGKELPTVGAGVGNRKLLEVVAAPDVDVVVVV